MNRIRAEESSAQSHAERLEAFVRDSGQPLLRYAYLLTGGHAASAEDLVQTVLLRLVRRGIADLDNPAAYARSALTNEHLSAARKAATQARAFPHLAALTEDRATPPAQGTEDRLAIFAALAALTPAERAVIVLRFYEDLPDDEIAVILRCSRATVRSHVHRARAKLRTVLSTTYLPEHPRSEHASAKEGRHDG